MTRTLLKTPLAVCALFHTTLANRRRAASSPIPAAQSSNTTDSTVLPEPTATPQVSDQNSYGYGDKRGLPRGAFIGILIAVILIAAGAVVLGIQIRRRRRDRRIAAVGPIGGEAPSVPRAEEINRTGAARPEHTGNQLQEFYAPQAPAHETQGHEMHEFYAPPARR
jgi:hypothetical protein